MFNNKTKQCKKKQTNTKVNDQETDVTSLRLWQRVLVLCTGSDQIAPGPAAQLSRVFYTPTGPVWDRDIKRRTQGTVYLICIWPQIRGQSTLTPAKSPFCCRWRCFYPVLSVRPVLPFPTAVICSSPPQFQCWLDVPNVYIFQSYGSFSFVQLSSGPLSKGFREPPCSRE